MTKECRRCRETKPVSEFGSNGKDEEGRTRLRSWCKPCVNAYAKERMGRIRSSTKKRCCARCQRLRPGKEFGRTYCRSCESERRKQYESQSGRTRKDYARNYYLVKTYGITQEQYEEMLAAQGGRCAICPAEAGDAKGRRLFIDHNHVTGEVREILCARCNFAVKGLADDPGWAHEVIAYVLRHHIVE